VELPTTGDRTEFDPSFSKLLLVEVYGEMSGRFLLPDDNSVQASQVIRLCVRNPFGYLKKVRLHRLDPQTGKITNRFLNIDKALKEGDESDNIILQGGDRLEIQNIHYPWWQN
jgi:hypothetical protein